MADSILVVVEQREGKLNRVSWETLTGAQALASETGWTLEAAVAGSGIGDIANEIAANKVAKVYALESPKLEPYTPDGFVAALKQFVEQKQPQLVLMPHTYQVRDFAPKLAAALGRSLISDSVGYKYEGGKLLFTRQMFQGKFAADVSFVGEAPYFATFQNGAFRGDQVQAGDALAPVETVNVEVADGVIRNKPEAPFKEAKQAVDLTQAEIIVAVGRGIKEQKNIEIAKQLAEALGGESAQLDKAYSAQEAQITDLQNAVSALKANNDTAAKADVSQADGSATALNQQFDALDLTTCGSGSSGSSSSS